MKATLHILDEVNIKFTGLEVNTRRKLNQALEFFLPHARHTPAFKLGRWNGKVSFCDLAARSYFHLLDKLLPIVINDGYDIEVVDQRPLREFNFAPITEESYSDQTWPKGHPAEAQPIVLRDYQVQVINNFLSNLQSLQVSPTGSGKCQPYSSKVLTESGWKTMADISVGDRVRTPDGNLASVLAVFEPGSKDVYEITFGDGRTVRSCGDHIWPVYNVEWKKWGKGAVRNISTTEIAAQLVRSKRAIGVPLATFEYDKTHIPLPMDPWLLGFLLGDGSFRNDHLAFSTADDEIVDKVRSKLGPDYTVKHKPGTVDYVIQFATREIGHNQHGDNLRKKLRNNSGHIASGTKTSANVYRQALIDLGLDHKLSHEKFIPAVYFLGSRDQRLEVIRGLMDSDGYISSSVSFTSVSKQLAQDFAALVHSVGGLAKIRHKSDRTYMYNGERKPAKDSYTVSVRYRTPRELVSLSRKVEKAPENYQYGATLKNRIISVTQVSHEPVKCIYIDHPDHLYITDGYMMTHNTIITAVLSHQCEPYGRTIVIVPNKDLVVQTEKDYINLGLDVGVYFGDRKDFHKTHTICTWQSLAVLEKATKAGTAEVSVEDFVRDVICIMVDEVHKVKGTVLREQLSGIFRNVPIRWGLTGTIPKEKNDEMACISCLGPVINALTSRELQDKGVLAELHVSIFQLQDGILGFKDYSQELKWLVTNPERVKQISDMINQISQSGNTLVLIDRIATGDMLQTLNPDWVFVSGEMKGVKRQAEYAEINESDNRVTVATYGVAAVGINIPRIFNLVMLEPGKSFVRVVQSIGRGIRKAADKDYVNIYDITSTLKYSKRHLALRKQYYKEQQFPYTVTKVNYK